MFNILPLPSSPDAINEFAVQSAIKQLSLETISDGWPVYVAADQVPRLQRPEFYGDFPDSRWCKIVRPFTGNPPGRTHDPDPVTNGYMLAGDAVQWLLGVYPGFAGVIPARVMVDEINLNTQVDLQAFADYMLYWEAYNNGEYYPWLHGKWGAFVYGARGIKFTDYEATLRKFWQAQATLSVEFYADHDQYCANGRDPWLIKLFFEGESAIGTLGKRGDWLWNLFLQHPGAGFTAILEVTACDAESQLNPPNPYPAWFLSRQMYIFRHYRTWAAGNATTHGVSGPMSGGFGSWKWHNNPALPCHVSVTSRDDAFRTSWNHYCRNGSIALESGVGACCL